MCQKYVDCYFSVFEVNDIIELFEDREQFLDRVDAVEELIENS